MPPITETLQQVISIIDLTNVSIVLGHLLTYRLFLNTNILNSTSYFVCVTGGCSTTTRSSRLYKKPCSRDSVIRPHSKYDCLSIIYQMEFETKKEMSQ